MKIAILTNPSTMDKCTGRGCLRAFYQRQDAFEAYDDEADLIGFTHAGGDLNKKIQKLKDNGVNCIHLSTCMRARYENYKPLMDELSKDFKVVGYTHGSKVRKSK